MDTKADNDRHNENKDSLVRYFFNEDIFVQVSINASNYAKDKCPRPNDRPYQVIKQSDTKAAYDSIEAVAVRGKERQSDNQQIRLVPQTPIHPRLDYRSEKN